jgi:citrate lyase subunit alpha/citrate CoA-transferase
VKGSTLPIRTIEEIKAEVEGIIGGRPEPPRLTDRPVAVIKWVDGTVIDTVWQVEE